jgi:hypothetical protein
VLILGALTTSRPALRTAERTAALIGDEPTLAPAR